MTTIRRLGPGDELLLRLLATDGRRFELDAEAGTREPLGAADAAAYLSDPSVLHWVAEDDGRVVGHLMGLVQRRRSGDPHQVLVYEIGVSDGSRRQGVGSTLMQQLDQWCAANAVRDLWVLADNEGAERFYAACGFTPDKPNPRQMSRRRGD